MFGSTSAYTVTIVDDFRQRIGRRVRHERLRRSAGWRNAISSRAA